MGQVAEGSGTTAELKSGRKQKYVRSDHVWWYIRAICCIHAKGINWQIGEQSANMTLEPKQETETEILKA